MSDSDSWPTEGESGAELFEQDDEALDEESRLNPDFDEQVQNDPSLDPSLQIDSEELKEAGAAFDDPEGEGWELDEAIDGTPATEENLEKP